MAIALGASQPRLLIWGVSLGVWASILGCSGDGTSVSRPRETSSVIQIENSRPGATDWLPTNLGVAHEIEGYASAVSVNRGETIGFFVNTSDSTYTLEVYRMGWYQGTGARRMAPAVTLPGLVQPIPSPDLKTGMVICHWRNPYVLRIPNTDGWTAWPSGMYIVKLTGSSIGKQALMTFVVRDDERPSNLLFQASVNTYQAYNSWGGTSLYANINAGSNDPNVFSGGHAVKVSFDRPYAAGRGTGNLLDWEINMVRWLERNGYDVTYSTDVDTDRDAAALLHHRAFLIVGHDEYWTWQMRDNVEAARDNGINIGYFGANASYWQVRYEPSEYLVPRRVIVGYKDMALTEDPYATDNDPTNDYLVTTNFQNAPVSRPQSLLFGLIYNTASYTIFGDIIVQDTSNPVFNGTGLIDGGRITKALGYEVDYLPPQGPITNFVLLGHSPFPSMVTPGAVSFGDMGMYQAPSGATVFSAGTVNWSWSLDKYPSVSRTPTSPAAQEMTRNILAMFGALPASGT